MFQERKREEKERTFKEDVSRKKKRREREDFQGRCFKKEKEKRKRKRKIEKEQIPILWNHSVDWDFYYAKKL